jgi:hypothetical protein
MMTRYLAPVLALACVLCLSIGSADARGRHPRPVERGGDPLAGVVAPLAAKAREIARECGSRVSGGVRSHSYYVAGTRRMSLHKIGRAVDAFGNPRCIYAHLERWPGGVSVDYSRVRHVHFSYDPGGREWGVRFAHGGGRHARRYARRHLGVRS